MIHNEKQALVASLTRELASVPDAPSHADRLAEYLDKAGFSGPLTEIHSKTPRWETQRDSLLAMTRSAREERDCALKRVRPLERLREDVKDLTGHEEFGDAVPRDMLLAALEGRLEWHEVYVPVARPRPEEAQ